MAKKEDLREIKELLTEEELSALLQGRAPLQPQAQAAAMKEKGQRITPYNFRRPDRVSKEQVRSLYLLHDTFAHNLSSALPLFLRAISEVTLISVEQQAYAEYLYGLPDPTVIFKILMEPLQGVIVLELNPSIAFPLIDRQLGGPGLPLPQVRPITEIEQNVLEGFMKVALENLRAAWKPITDVSPIIDGCETSPQLLQIVSPNEVVLSIIFHVRIAEVRGTMSICIPAITLEPIIQRFNQSFYSHVEDVPQDQTRCLLDTLSNVDFSVAAELRGTTTTIGDILKMNSGDVLRLDHRADEPVEISIGEIVKFRGDIVANRDKMAIHLRSFVRKYKYQPKPAPGALPEETSLQFGD